MPTTLPIRRRRKRAHVSDIAWIAMALAIGAAALWIAFGSPVFSQPNPGAGAFDARSP